MTDSIKRIGIMTGGGDCPGLNAVIRGATRTAIREFGWEVVGLPDSFIGLLSDDPTVTQLDLTSSAGILHQGGTIIGTSNRSDPFDYPVVQPDGSVTREDKSELLLQRIREFGVDALISVGGDGTQKLSLRLAEMGLKLVGVPKTIDNDLAATDYTFGFDSACNIAMEAIDRLRTTAYSHQRILVMEVMGRYAGWIALQSGLSGGAHGIVIPEIPYSAQKLADDLNRRYREGRRFSIVVVAEGAKPIDGDYSTVEGTRLGGAAERLSEQLKPLVDQEIRSTVLGHIQRGGSPTHFDRVLGTRFGHEAARMIAKGQFTKMVALHGTHIAQVDLAAAIEQLKVVDVETNELVRAGRDIGVAFGD